MAQYLVKRVLGALPVFFGITLLVFFLMNMAPATIADLAGGEDASSAAARAALEAETYSYQQTVLSAFKEVDNALTTFSKIRDMRESRARLEEAARSYMELANLQYINGVISYLDVLDAQRGYFDAQIGLNNAVRDELLSVVNLYKALGGGWQ